MKPPIIILTLLLAVALGAYIFIPKESISPAPEIAPGPNSNPDQNLNTDSGATTDQYENTYTHPELGISFRYPHGYILNEIGTAALGTQNSAPKTQNIDGPKNAADTKDTKNTTDKRYLAITLIREEDNTPRENGEGPTAITLDIYENEKNQTLTEWLGNIESNFQISTGTYTTRLIDGVEAITYKWSGLYEGETTALLHDDKIIAISVTHLTPADENISVYQNILENIALIAL